LGMSVALQGQLRLANPYAVTIDSQSSEHKIHIAFKDDADARRLRKLFRANPWPLASRLRRANWSSPSRTLRQMQSARP
jgi:hypothetical protein